MAKHKIVSVRKPKSDDPRQLWSFLFYNGGRVQIKSAGPTEIRHQIRIREMQVEAFKQMYHDTVGIPYRDEEAS